MFNSPGLSFKKYVTAGPVAGMQLWLDASTTTLGAISSWTDLSGNGNHATQSSALKKPISTASQLNSLKTLLFVAASSQTLILPSALYSIPNGANTIFTVASTSNSVVNPERIVCGSVAGANRYNILTFNPNSYSYVNSATAQGLDKSGITVTNYNLAVGTRSGTARTLTLNAGTPVTDSNGSSDTLGELFIGSRADAFDYLTGGIAEILIYNTLLSAPDIATNTAYLKAKWGI